jgi:hypothetical protein
LIQQSSPEKNLLSGFDQILPAFGLAFPDFDILEKKSASGKASLPILTIDSSRDSEQRDALQISGVVTYGADVPEALISFYEYCSDAQTKIRCQNLFVRSLFAASLDDRIL